MTRKYQTFREFYPYYLSEHANPVCRTLHFAGSILVLIISAAAIITANAWWLAAIPFAGYGFAWAGHFFFEHNRPATFSYPVFSLIADWALFYHLLTGKISFTGPAK